MFYSLQNKKIPDLFLLNATLPHRLTAAKAFGAAFLRRICCGIVRDEVPLLKGFGDVCEKLRWKLSFRLYLTVCNFMAMILR